MIEQAEQEKVAAMQETTCAGCYFWKDGRGTRNYCRVINQMLGGYPPAELVPVETGQLNLLDPTATQVVLQCHRHTEKTERKKTKKIPAPLPGQVGMFA